MASGKEKLLNNIMLFVLFFYFLMINLSNHNLYSNIAIVFLLIWFIIFVFAKNKIYFDKYFFVNLLFIIYQLFLFLIGYIYNSNETLKIIITLCINLTIFLMIYNIIISGVGIDNVLKVYLLASTLSLIIIMFLLRGSLFSGRLAHAYGEGSVSFYFLGKPVSISSNGIAFYCALSLYLCLYFFSKEKNKIYIFLSLFLSFGCILTGSRKGILLLVLYGLYFVYFNGKKDFIKKLFIFLLILLTLYYVIVHIPIFNNIIGKRITALINSFFGEKVSEGSIVARNYYKNLALTLISKNIIFGYGVGYFSSVYGNVTEINYLEILCGGGLIGLFIYYFNYLLIIINYCKNKSHYSYATKFLFVIVIALLVNDMGSVTYNIRSCLIAIIFYISSVKLDKLRCDDE